MIVQATFHADMVKAEGDRNCGKPIQHAWVARNGRCNPSEHLLCLLLPSRLYIKNSSRINLWLDTGLFALRQLDTCFRDITERFVWKVSARMIFTLARALPSPIHIQVL